jgi:hypothetical protein
VLAPPELRVGLRWVALKAILGTGLSVILGGAEKGSGLPDALISPLLLRVYATLDRQPREDDGHLNPQDFSAGLLVTRAVRRHRRRGVVELRLRRLAGRLEQAGFEPVHREQEQQRCGWNHGCQDNHTASPHWSIT